MLAMFAFDVSIVITGMKYEFPSLNFVEFPLL